MQDLNSFYIRNKINCKEKSCEDSGFNFSREIFIEHFHIYSNCFLTANCSDESLLRAYINNLLRIKTENNSREKEKGPRKPFAGCPLHDIIHDIERSAH